MLLTQTPAMHLCTADGKCPAAAALNATIDKAYIANPSGEGTRWLVILNCLVRSVQWHHLP